MNLKEMIEALRIGNKVKRSKWIGQDECFIKCISKDNKDEIQLFVENVTYYGLPPDILLSTDWIVNHANESDNQLFLSFYEMIDSLLKGTRAWLPEWEDKYISMENDTKEVILKYYIPQRYNLTYSDLTAEDWEIMA